MWWEWFSCEGQRNFLLSFLQHKYFLSRANICFLNITVTYGIVRKHPFAMVSTHTYLFCLVMHKKKLTLKSSLSEMNAQGSWLKQEHHVCTISERTEYTCRHVSIHLLQVLYTLQISFINYAQTRKASSWQDFRVMFMQALAEKAQKTVFSGVDKWLTTS